MNDHTQRTPKGVFPQLKSVVLGLLLFAGVGLVLYLVAAVANLALGAAILFLLFPVATTLVSYLTVHALLNLVYKGGARRTISTIFATLVLLACVTFQLVTKRYTLDEVISGKTYWSKVIPTDIQGRWAEVSDIVTLGRKSADVIDIGAQSLRVIQHIPYSCDPPRTNQYFGIAVAQQNHTVTLHCPCEVFGKRIFSLSLEDSGNFIHIREVTECDTAYDYSFLYYLGRFCRQE